MVLSMCSARSLYRIINETESTLELNTGTPKETRITIQGSVVFGIDDGRKFSAILFDWSPSLRGNSWLYKNARVSKRDTKIIYPVRKSSSTSALCPGRNLFLRCRSAERAKLPRVTLLFAVTALSPLREDEKTTVKFWVG